MKIKIEYSPENEWTVDLIPTNDRERSVLELMGGLTDVTVHTQYTRQSFSVNSSKELTRLEINGRLKPETPQRIEPGIPVELQ
jgi:hypothetical protein